MSTVVRKAKNTSKGRHGERRCWPVKKCVRIYSIYFRFARRIVLAKAREPSITTIGSCLGSPLSYFITVAIVYSSKTLSFMQIQA